MVLSIVVFPIPEGPNKQIISPLFSIRKETLFTLFLALAVKVTLSISKKFFTFNNEQAFKVCIYFFHLNFN